MAAFLEAGPLEELEEPLFEVRKLVEADASPSYNSMLALMLGCVGARRGLNKGAKTYYEQQSTPSKRCRQR